jgi:hypothetical protein
MEATILIVPNSFSGKNLIIKRDPMKPQILAIKSERKTYCPLLLKKSLIKTIKLFIFMK